MDSLLQADVFFFVTTVSVVLVTVLLAVAIFYIIRILKDFNDISRILKSGAQGAQENFSKLCDAVYESPVFTFIFGKSFRKSSSRRSSKGAKNTAREE